MTDDADRSQEDGEPGSPSVDAPTAGYPIPDRTDPSSIADRRLRAVCFDMDGVLLDSESHWHAVETTDILPWAVPGASVDPAEITGMYYEEIYDYLDDRYGTAVSKDAFIARFDQFAAAILGDRADIMPGLDDLIRALLRLEVTLALVTSSPSHWLDVALDRLAMADQFDAIISAGDVPGAGKPDPYVYERAAERMGVPPSECIAVEDSRHGLEAAHRAGMYTIAFRLGGSPADGPADETAADPESLHHRLLTFTANCP